MRLPARVSPAAERRRALLFDLGLALAFAAIAVVVSAGVGVVGFAGLLVAIFLITWIVVEKAWIGLSRRRRLHRR